MKLLFGQNPSPRLVQQVSDLYPGSVHVYSIGLDQASDAVVWNFAHEQAFTLVTKDADFSEMSGVLGFPPKVIWIRRGNCSTRQIESLLQQHQEAIPASIGTLARVFLLSSELGSKVVQSQTSFA